MNLTVINDKIIDKAILEKAAYTLRALANETRLAIVLQLARSEEKTVSELMEAIKCEQSLLSHHLTDMRAKGVLNCRRSGKNCFYSLGDKNIVRLLECVLRCETNEK